MNRLKKVNNVKQYSDTVHGYNFVCKIGENSYLRIFKIDSEFEGVIIEKSAYYKPVLSCKI